MDLQIKRKSNKTFVVGSLLETYPHDLQMYKVPPVEDIKLNEFETLALERHNLLKIIAETTTSQGLKMFSTEWKEHIFKKLDEKGLKYYSKLCKNTACGTTNLDLQARRKDHISHFILRLAYCRTEELRRWFIARELELFRMRFNIMSPTTIAQFFKLNDLCYTEITDDERNNISNLLQESTFQSNVDKFYKVKFYEVLDLVKTRKVYLSGGYAYVPDRDFVSVLSAQYRTHLKQALAVASQHLGEIEQDERLVPLLKGLHKSYAGNDYSETKVMVPIESLDSLSVKCYPLCMKQLHEQLRSVHHLKHDGRLQYGLFLKGIGVTLEDSLRFWRDEFTKMMDIDKFEKQYAYNVRYNYGKEGSKKNYTPFSCMKIISGMIGPGQCHGCPFRHSDPSNLKNKLEGYGYNTQAINTIVDLAKKGHYQIACSKYFDATHNVEMNLGINHPNQYFEESQKLSGAIKKEIKSDNIKKEIGAGDMMIDNDIEMSEWKE